MADMFDMVEAMRAKSPGTKDPPRREPWRAVSEWAMTRGKYSIAQYGRKPAAIYLLFGEGPQAIGKDSDYRVLMAMADRLDEGEGNGRR